MGWWDNKKQLAGGVLGRGNWITKSVEAEGNLIEGCWIIKREVEVSEIELEV